MTNNFIMCPKCRKKLLGVSHPPRLGKEYFAHCCHQYFGTAELVHQWGYDAGDLLDDMVNLRLPTKNTQLRTTYYSEFVGGEPYWSTEQERADAYNMVNRMLMGIEEIDDWEDMLSTCYDAYGIGVQ